jgi:DNA-binding NarL/FixJ family response regulator
VLVADAHCVTREGLKALVGALPDMRVVGEACDGPAALALAAELNPDVVVLEASLPGLDGAQVTARLREACPGRGVVVLTACEHPGTVRLALGVGARGYVLKRSPAEELVRAVRAVAAGGAYIDPEVAACVVGGGAENADGELSAREAQVRRLMALGYTNKQIASRLALSVKTVETYKARSMEKLHMRSRVDVVRHAVASGWMDDADEPLLATHDGPRGPGDGGRGA